LAAAMLVTPHLLEAAEGTTTTFGGQKGSTTRSAPAAGATTQDGPGPDVAPPPPAPGSVFSPRNTFVPPDQLKARPATRSAPPRADDPDYWKRALGSQSVTPDGKVDTQAVPADTMQRLLRSIGKDKPEMIEEPKKSEKGGAARGGTGAIGQARAVIGIHERSRVTNTGVFPFSTIGYIGIGCSGTLVGPRHVLTAGHCVYNRDERNWYRNLDFWPGQNANHSPFGKATWKQAFTMTGYITEGHSDFDVAMIVLNQDIGRSAGWVAFGYREPLPKYNINVIGFPGDKEKFTMWMAYCPIKDFEPQSTVMHVCDTYPGNSGSGMLVVQGTNHVIYGIHSFGRKDAGINGGPMINQAKFEVMKGWLDNN
jgi:V8-like Glu-specific endopeptidase